MQNNNFDIREITPKDVELAVTKINLNNAQEELKKYRTEHTREIRRLKKQQGYEIAKATVTLEEELIKYKSLLVDHENNIVYLEVKQQQKFIEIKDKHTEEINKLKAEHNETIQRLKYFEEEKSALIIETNKYKDLYYEEFAKNITLNLQTKLLNNDHEIIFIDIIAAFMSLLIGYACNLITSDNVNVGRAGYAVLAFAIIILLVTFIMRLFIASKKRKSSEATPQKPPEKME